MEENNQYKGIFYKNKVSHKFYEGGAHFSYYSLIKILNEIKDDLNKEREKDLLLNKNETKEKIIKENEIKEIIDKIEIKKINIPILSKQKNKSMSYLINDNKVKSDIITKKSDDQFQNVNNNKIKNEQNIKNAECSNSVKRINKINNKYFNNSIYKNGLNMPIIYNQKNRSEGKTIGDNNILLKKKNYLEPIKNKYNYHIKMSSTIGFNENNKFYNYYMNNYNNFDNKVSRNKNNNNNNNSSVGQSLNKYNNNTNIVDKFNLINNYNKNKFFEYLPKNKIYNSNSIDYNINNNYVKLNKNRINNTKINFNKPNGLNGKIIINGDKKRDKMNLSIINFAMIKNKNKFYISKNK